MAKKMSFKRRMNQEALSVSLTTGGVIIVVVIILLIVFANNSPNFIVMSGGIELDLEKGEGVKFITEFGNEVIIFPYSDTFEILDGECETHLEEFNEQCFEVLEGPSICPIPNYYKCGDLIVKVV